MAHESAAGPLRQKRRIPKNLIVQQRTGGLQRGESSSIRPVSRSPAQTLCRVAPAQGLFHLFAFGDVARQSLKRQQSRRCCPNSARSLRKRRFSRHPFAPDGFEMFHALAPPDAPPEWSDSSFTRSGGKSISIGLPRPPMPGSRRFSLGARFQALIVPSRVLLSNGSSEESTMAARRSRLPPPAALGNITRGHRTISTISPFASL